MTKTLFLAFFMTLSMGIFAQKNIDYSNVKLETAADFSAAEPIVLSAANYILGTPSDLSDKQRVYASQLIMTWMEATPDYEFALKSVDKLGDDLHAKIVYSAATAKYYLDNKANTPNADQLWLNSWKMLLDYANNPINKIKQTSTLRKLTQSAAKSDAELAAAIKK